MITLIMIITTMMNGDHHNANTTNKTRPTRAVGIRETRHPGSSNSGAPPRLAESHSPRKQEPAWVQPRDFQSLAS